MLDEFIYCRLSRFGLHIALVDDEKKVLFPDKSVLLYLGLSPESNMSDLYDVFPELKAREHDIDETLSGNNIEFTIPGIRRAGKKDISYNLHFYSHLNNIFKALIILENSEFPSQIPHSMLLNDAGLAVQVDPLLKGEVSAWQEHSADSPVPEQPGVQGEDGVGRFKHSVVDEYGSFINSLIDVIPYPMFYVNLDRLIIGCNKAFAVLMGKPKQKMVGKHESEVFSDDVSAIFKDKESELNNKNTQVFSITLDTGGRSFRDIVVYRTVYTRQGWEDGIIVNVFMDITEWQKTEMRVKILSQAVEQSPASIVITDVNGNIEYINPKFTEVTGYETAEIIGKNPRILKSGNQSDEFYKKMWDTILNGNEWYGEFHNIKKNGESYWEMTSISPMVDNNGEIRHFIGVKEDITALKNIQEELSRSEEKLSVLFESIAEGVAVADLDFYITQVNEAMMRMCRCDKRQQLIGKKIDAFIHFNNTIAIREALLDSQDKKNNEIFETRLISDDDTSLDIEVSVSLLRDKDNNPSGYSLIVKNITERKIAEKALRISEERNRAILESVPDLMFRINSRGENLDEVLAGKISMVFPKTMLEKSRYYIEKSLLTKEIQIFEYPIMIEGRLDFYEARFIATDVDEVLVILRNVTARKYAEEEMLKAKNAAEKANSSKSEFLANMSHEIRTPLNSIQGYLELLKKTSLDEKQQEYIETVSMSARNLLGIINDILDISKIESKKLDIDDVEFNPLVEFESAINLFNVKALEKNIRLMSFIDPRLPLSVHGDPLRIKQVLSNLLSNAIKFTHENGFVQLEVRVRDELDNICFVEYSVSDNGIGIPESKRESIFQSFTQADSSVARLYGGTGLGLSISSNLVNLMGARLSLESKTGAGSRFYFTLAMEKSVQSEPRLYEKTNRELDVALFTQKSIVEQGENVRNYLESLGYKVMQFDSFHNAAACKADIAFVIFDELKTVEIRDFARSNRNKKVIAVSFEFDRQKIKELGNDIHDVMFHPINPLSIYNIINKIINPSEAVDEKAVAESEKEAVSFSARALIAEDNIINQTLLKLILEQFGLQSDIADNGIVAYEMFTKNAYDIIFMDINMPALDGIESARMIMDYEKEKNQEHVPVIALTARAIHGDRENLLESGMDGYVAKPIEIDDLSRVLGEYLGHKKIYIDRSVIDMDKIEVGARDFNYDINAIAAQLMISPDKFQIIVEKFFETSRDTLITLEKKINSGDLESVYQLSHKLKGASDNLRFISISEIARELEAASKNSEIIDYQEKFAELKETFESIRKSIS